MNIWSFYDPATGVFTGGRFRGPQRALAANTPEGLAAFPGVVDHSRQRLDASGALVQYQPPKPEETELLTWSWHEESQQWLSYDTDAAVAAKVRKARADRLSACDWVVAKATEAGTPVPQQWVDYRQALRDVTQQPGFPRNVTWPEVPS